MKKIFALTLILLLMLASIGCSETADDKKADDKGDSDSAQTKKIEKESAHFGFMPATFDLKDAQAAGGSWDRPFFELFEWGRIETEPGTFNFIDTDQYVKMVQERDFCTVACIQPFADWDQKANEGKYPEIASSDPNAPKTRAKPSNMNAYKRFVEMLVERYDGDGTDDMPDLKYPIKYWEVANEPEMQEPPLVFFQGPPKEYFEVLKATYEAVKNADKDAKILNGGMAGMSDFMVQYWQGVLDEGGGKYFDIANIHSIGHGEPLNIPEFKEFLLKNNIDKSIWVTEVQIENRGRKESRDYYAASLARSYIFALANGADKFFYVNLKLPDEGLPSEGEGGPGFSDRSTIISVSNERQPLFFAHKTIAKMLDYPLTAEKIREEISGGSGLSGENGNKKIVIGQYKFSVEGKTIYALWGSGSVPAEISGRVKVTYLSGDEKEMDAGELTLTESPIFVEKL